MMIGKWLWPKTRKSHPFSKLLRPVFENKRLKEVFGIFLIIFIFLSGLLVPPASAFETYPNEELITLGVELEVNTEKGLKPPLNNFYISQGYWLLHPAVDLVAPKGTPVYPVMAGKIERVESGRGGYGSNIVINHGNQLKSLYAHLSEVEVENGEDVSQTTIIGRVGSTGWTTGSHLHLEIRENGKHLNPRTFLR